jgi:hypothetical protein
MIEACNVLLSQLFKKKKKNLFKVFFTQSIAYMGCPTLRSRSANFFLLPNYMDPLTLTARPVCCEKDDAYI